MNARAGVAALTKAYRSHPELNETPEQLRLFEEICAVAEEDDESFEAVFLRSLWGMMQADPAAREVAVRELREYFQTNDERERNIEKLKMAFDHADMDGSREVSRKELEQMLGYVPTKANADVTASIFSRADVDGNGVLSLDEFLAELGNNPEVATRLLLQRAFAQADKDASGKIDSKELMLCLAAMGNPLPEETITEIFHQCDTDGDGTLSLNEFLEAMHGCP